VIVDIPFEFFAAHTLNDVSSQRESIIGIGRDFARRKNTGWHLVHEVGAQRFQVTLVGHEQILQCVLESGRVGEQLSQRDRLRICFRNCQIEVTANVAVEIEFALFDQLHHGCGSE
jgi:hypothetical protein